MDLSYTDPNYTPVYSLDGYSADIIASATTLCEKQGLTGTLLKGCIYDVVVSNDTALVDQETLKTGCPNQCSGKGRCVNNTCQCAAGWSAEDCHVGSCGNCYHGNCEAGFCQCHIGWDGVDCSQKATCDKVRRT
ncbi:hypothetical protein NP493_884g04017 [Ridgeia piscesae]|uniref:Uncharacterized protein n=1 Tax=Ridgeia piscesae TaxID=27915 RepID=A0AAD9KMB6_RIDPI|nr:hypothetical protein NP493_884g04017 [Ridgeia piscesae]